LAAVSEDLIAKPQAGTSVSVADLYEKLAELSKDAKAKVEGQGDYSKASVGVV